MKMISAQQQLVVLFLVACIEVSVLGFVVSAKKWTTPRNMASSTVETGVDQSTSGFYLAKTPLKNKGTSFSNEERDNLGLRGLFPAGDSQTLERKLETAMENFRDKVSPIEKYIFLHTIQDCDETLYYSILVNHTFETMPFVYTPTVGEACQKWSSIYRHTPRGLYLSINDKGSIRSILDNYPLQDINTIVFTDGERILGLGDQGVNGMGIPIGKLALYTACAGIDPSKCLPVHIDVGCNRKEYREDPKYMGLRQERDRSPAYGELIQEFFDACQDKYGRQVLMQFEDFGNSNAFSLLEKHRHTACVFNDDIQGTASVVLAGVIASLSLCDKKELSDHTFLFYGAGEAGVGIGMMISEAIAIQTGCTVAEGAAKIWFVDSKGLITNARTDELAHHKLPFAHNPPAPSADAPASYPDSKEGEALRLLEAVKSVKPSAIIGVSAQGGSFTKAVCEEMAKINANPLIFALSNPTSKAECTATQAYEWTNGKCVFASGSPFDPVTLADGRVFTPGQGNNAYIFPGVGLGCIVSKAMTITDEDMYIAAVTLASCVEQSQLDIGNAYPPLSSIRSVSAKIAAAVAKNVFATGRNAGGASEKAPEDMLAACEATMYFPKY